MQTMDRIILREPPFHRSRTFPVHCTQVLVWFYSDDTFVHEGFSLEYQITPDPVAIQSPCEYNRLITPGQGGYSRHGFIKADTDNGSDGNMDCSIYLNASSEYHITMRIQYIAINCSEGLFEIYGEYSATPYCGFYTPDYSIYSIRNWHRYRFVTTSVSYCQSGFSFYYTTFHTENIMKSNYCFYLLATLMSMIATVSSDVYGYYHFDISSPCENNRVIAAGQGTYSRYGFIKADSDNCIDSHLDCSIHLNASSGYHITMRIQYIKTDCDDGMFEIHGETGITPYCGFYTPPYSIYSSTNWLKYRFHTNDVTYCQSGFSFYYTTYHTGECSSDEFRCDFENRCIPKELACDMYDNCGDWSDEISSTCGLTTGAIAAISVTCVLVGLSCIAFLVYCLYDKKHRSQHNSTTRRGSSNRCAPSTATTVPIGPPTYAENPPDYTYINSVYSGVYEDLNNDPYKAPPSYQAITNNNGYPN